MASVKGTLKTLSLVGGDLTFKIEHSDIGAVLKALELPLIASGPTQIDTHIKDVGKKRQLDFKRSSAISRPSVKGTLKTLSLVGSDLKFEATAADAARLASVFERQRCACGAAHGLGPHGASHARRSSLSR